MPNVRRIKCNDKALAKKAFLTLQILCAQPCLQKKAVERTDTAHQGAKQQPHPWCLVKEMKGSSRDRCELNTEALSHWKAAAATELQPTVARPERGAS